MIHRKYFCLILFCSFLLNTLGILADELPSVRYVVSKDGLNKRETASVSGKKTGALLYGARVIVYERSDNPETIDGITDYWYKCRREGGYWVFGAYLFPRMPDDTPPVLGYWNTDQGERYYWDFGPDFTVRFGRKETDTGWSGTWVLHENRLEVSAAPSEFSPGESRNLVIMVTVINRDELLFKYTDGKEELLIRNNGII